MSRLIVILAVLLTMLLFPKSGKSQDSLPQPETLTSVELRQILGQLHELSTCRAETEVLREYITQDREIDTREREVSNHRLTVCEEKITLANQTAALQKERADFYENLYRAFTRKPSFGCRIARVITIGIYRCR